VTSHTLFLRFVNILVVVLVLYGVGMTIAVLAGSPYSSRLISGFGSMFIGILGLGSGYLLGVRAKNGNGHE
jgi:hypothetical protein